MGSGKASRGAQGHRSKVTSIPSTCYHCVCRSGPPKDRDGTGVGHSHTLRSESTPLLPLWASCVSTPVPRALTGVWPPAWGSPALRSLRRGHTVGVTNSYPRPHAISTPSPLGVPCPSGHQAPGLPAADRMGSSGAGVVFEGEVWWKVGCTQCRELFSGNVCSASSVVVVFSLSNRASLPPGEIRA